MMQHGPGLAASPVVRNNLEVGGEKYSIAARIPHVSSFLQTALSKLPRKKSLPGLVSSSETVLIGFWRL
jgi:hypothetical protein